MKTKHKPQRKRKYVASVFSNNNVIARSTWITPENQVQCALQVRIAWESMRNGNGSHSDVDSLSNAASICVMAARKLDAIAQNACLDALFAVGAIADRYSRVKRFGIDAAALRDIPPMLDFYEELLSAATVADLSARFLDLIELKNIAYKEVTT